MIILDSLEEKFGITLPHMYKLFAQTFELTDIEEMVDKYYDPKYDDYYYCSTIIYEPEPDRILFGGLHSAENALRTWSNDDFWMQSGYLPISKGTSKGIVIGLTEEIKDQVFFDEIDVNQRFRKIADNIFEFVQNLVFHHMDEELLNEGVSFSKLYKNWGEDYWRVRDID